MTIPNYRDAICCLNCIYGKVERSRCEEYKIYCEHKNHLDEVSETSVCDDYGV